MNMAQLWGGRFTKETDQLVYNFNASIGFDQKFYEQDIRGSLAHVNEKTGTPSKVIWLLFVFTSLILIFGSSQTVYVLIVDVFSFGLVVVWLLVSIAFLRLRKLRPTLERPYRIKHPALIGWWSILFCIWFLYLYMPFGPAGLTNAEWATIGAVAVLALIVYFGWNRRGGKIPDEERRDLFGISQK